MSKNSTLLSKQIRIQLKELLQLLKLKKAAIAKHLNIAESTFSEATGVNGKRKIDPKKWQLLQTFIIEEIKSQDEQQNLSSIEHNRVNILFNDVFKNKQTLQSPIQGPLASKEHNYIHRDSDDLLESRLQKNCCYFWINGGIKKGKTSLLNKITEFCHTNSINYHLCDLKQLIDCKKSKTKLTNQSILQFIINKTTNNNELLINTDFDELCAEFKSKFVDWRKNGTLSGEKFFITIDHIDSLFEPLIDVTAPGYDAISIIHFILQTFLTLSRELNNIRFAIVVEDYLYTSAKISPLINQAARIALKPLTADEIVKLWGLCKPQDAVFDIGLEQALTIIERISGNPYLVQHLFHDIYNNTLPNKPLNAYLLYVTTALNGESSSKLQGYTLFSDQLLKLIKKVALQT